MEVALEPVVAVRDNAGIVGTTLAVPHGCKGPACPAFALCMGRCDTRRAPRPAVATAKN